MKMQNEHKIYDFGKKYNRSFVANCTTFSFRFLDVFEKALRGFLLMHFHSKSQLELETQWDYSSRFSTQLASAPPQ